MNLQTKQSLVISVSKQYKKASWKERRQMVDQLAMATGYSRHYSSFILLHPPGNTKKKLKRIRKSKYGVIVTPLKKLWGISNFASGKRLVGMLPSYVETLTRDRELFLADKQKELLMQISAATIERLITGERKKVFGKGKTTTKPGTLLKHQIPIHVFTRWDDRKPGFGEIDLVAHCGVTVKGHFAYTLDFIDLDTNWDECVAFLGKGENNAMKAVQTVREWLPFALLGIDSDNGEEFINWELYRWCKKEKITFTRCREYRKNDQAHVEEKNWSVVRRYTGYKRFETQEQVDLLNKLYEQLRLYFNFFQATLKLERKERDGAKVKRIYPKAKTPYQRVIEHKDIPEVNKHKLREQYQTLNPAKLLRAIQEITDQLLSN
ncbi:MAG: hypothetical protein ACR2LN_00810 [Candidatus Levyibacteriota bacterium]